MAQKYRIYINEKVILLTASLPKQREIYQELDVQHFDLKTIYANLNVQGGKNYLYVLCDEPKVFLKKVIKSNTLVEAAGGIVENDKGEFLFIYRNNKWDLPKGKLEKGESVKEGAVREVEEECGITVSKAGKKLVKTYHTYLVKGELVLKKTHWYKMEYRGKEKLIPQIEEGITEVRWFNRDHLQAIKANTFPSIMDVLKKMKLLKEREVRLQE